MVNMRLLATTAVLLAASSIQAQHANHAAPSAELPAGSIDGSKNPEAIPDETAWEVFLHTVAARANASEQERKSSRDKFANAWLSEKDTATLEAILADFHAQVGGFNARLGQMRATRSLSDSSASALDKELRNFRLTARNALVIGLSPEGVAKLEAHVNGLKRNIKIINGPYRSSSIPTAR